jgi:hypothetical protein
MEKILQFDTETVCVCSPRPVHHIDVIFDIVQNLSFLLFHRQERKWTEQYIIGYCVNSVTCNSEFIFLVRWIILRPATMMSFIYSDFTCWKRNINTKRLLFTLTLIICTLAVSIFRQSVSIDDCQSGPGIMTSAGIPAAIPSPPTGKISWTRRH